MSKKNRSGAQKRRARLSRTEPPPEQPPKFGPPAPAVRETPRVAEVEWTQPEIDKVFEQTVRSLLQVPANQPEDLSALLVIDERLDERLPSRSFDEMDAPRAEGRTFGCAAHVALVAAASGWPARRAAASTGRGGIHPSTQVVKAAA